MSFPETTNMTIKTNQSLSLNLNLNLNLNKCANGKPNLNRSSSSSSRSVQNRTMTMLTTISTAKTIISLTSRTPTNMMTMNIMTTKTKAIICKAKRQCNHINQTDSRHRT